MKRLKAYEVRDNHEGHCSIEFATSSAAARREGASELGIDWESVEHCRRKPAFDQYAPGPVPKRVLIDHGWWFSCYECDRMVSNELNQEVQDEGLNPDDFDIIIEGRAVFCSRSCSNNHWLKERRREAAHAAFIEVVEAKFPGCQIIHLSIYADKLVESSDTDPTRAECVAHFKFPGGKGQVRWIFGDPLAFVAQEDVDAFRALYRKPTDAAAA